MLLTGREAERVSLSQGQKQSIRLRYGSKGEIIRELQQKLKALNYYSGRIDTYFGQSTLIALLAFQTDYFGKDADDGIVGPITATELNIDLPGM
jgi:N-acetylmuramoyl-L-alanine amidase